MSIEFLKSVPFAFESVPFAMDPAFSLTIFNSESRIYTLKIMTVVALVFVPIVIAYQTWIYRIFRPQAGDEGLREDLETY